MVKIRMHHTFFFILLLQSYISALVLESKKLSDVYTYIDKDTIAVFDIDNTLIRISPAIEPWFQYKIAKLEKKGLSHQDALGLVFSMYFLLTSLTQLLPISNSPVVIDTIQKKDIPVIALTNRSLVVATRTIERLKKIAIDFSKNILCDHDLDVSSVYKALYSQGIIFTGSNDKGKTLFIFFKKINYTPKKIVFVNDRMVNVVSVQKAAEEHGIPYVGIRLTLMDKAKNEFDPVWLESTVQELQVKLGLLPIHAVQVKGWKESLWDIISWPINKIHSLFS